MFPINSFTSPTLLSTILNFAAGFCALLAIFLVIVAFSVIVSLTIVSAVHLVSKTLGGGGGSGPRDAEAGPSAEAAAGGGAVNSNRQIVEMLDRIIRSVGEGRREAERLGEALERMPPRAPYGATPEGSAKDCVICLEDFEAEDFCQVFPVCGHVFHSSCIRNWLRKNPTCPLCRACILVQTGCQK